MLQAEPLPPYSSLFPIKEAFCSVLCLGLAKWEDLRFSEDMMCFGVGWTWIHLDKSNKKAFQLFVCSWHLIPVFYSKPVVAGLWIRWKFLCPDSHVPCPCLFGVHAFLSSFTCIVEKTVVVLLDEDHGCPFPENIPCWMESPYVGSFVPLFQDSSNWQLLTEAGLFLPQVG